jgi:hypothetical protein
VAVQFPAFCPKCGLIFRSNLFHIAGGARNITLEGNRETCPRCGALAELPDGTFDVIDDTIHVLAASQLTRERLFRLQTILEAAQAGEISDADATEAVAEEAPELRPFLDRFGPKMGRALLWFLLAAIQILAAQYLAENRSDAATPADVQRAVEQAVERCSQPPYQP